LQARGIELEAREWRCLADGVLVIERTLPNGIAFGMQVVPRRDHIAVEQWLTNGTDKPLTGLGAQDCTLVEGGQGLHGSDA
jgi:hypothetical protein